MVSKGAESSSNKVVQSVVQTFSAVFYMADKERANRRAQRFMADPTPSQAFKAWDLLEGTVMREALKLALPSIDYMRKIYVARTAPRITLQSVL